MVGPRADGRGLGRPPVGVGLPHGHRPARGRRVGGDEAAVTVGGVLEAVGVHAVGPAVVGVVVAEVDEDGVPDLGPEDRPGDPGVGPDVVAALQRLTPIGREGPVPDRPVGRVGRLEGRPHHLVGTGWDKVVKEAVGLDPIFLRLPGEPR